MCGCNFIQSTANRCFSAAGTRNVIYRGGPILRGTATVNVEPIQAKRLGIDLTQVDFDGLTIVGANLNFNRLIFGQHFYAVELGFGGDAVDFVQALANFVLDGSQVFTAVGTGFSLNGQDADALEVVVDLVQRAFRGLCGRDAVVGVTGSLVQTVDLRTHAVGNGLAGGVVFGAVDTQTGRQSLNCSA